MWEQQQSKSIKADDACNPVHLWNTRVWALPHDQILAERFQLRFGKCALDAIRERLLCRWRVNVLRSFLRYLRMQYSVDCKNVAPHQLQFQLDVKAGRECLWRVAEADWWDWRCGSRLFFWRWPPDQRKVARDGYEPYIEGPLPKYLRPQPCEPDADTRAKVKAKLSNVRDKRYVRPGRVQSLTSYFSVPKGDTDVRMVYDATRSSLNAALWAPNFGLPTVETVLRGVDEDSWMGDLDIGEMFLNFQLHPKLQPLCGVDLRPYFPEEVPNGKTLWERWVRCMMGMKNSPYVCIKGLLLALELMRGNTQDPGNPFHWDSIQLNLPGDPNYDPRRPRLQKVKGEAKQLAPLIVSYVDDMRAAGASAEECWHIMHVVSTRAAYLGIQVAARKTRPPAKNPGPWAGSVVVSSANGVAVKATQEKWDKTKSQIQQTLDLVEANEPLSRKLMESIRGSLVYLQRTYPAITPFVKGYHLTIDSWRPNRDAEGWRIAPQQASTTPLTPPEFVTPVPRFHDDLLALTKLLNLLLRRSGTCAPIKSWWPNMALPTRRALVSAAPCPAHPLTYVFRTGFGRTANRWLRPTIAN